MIVYSWSLFYQLLATSYGLFEVYDFKGMMICR